MAANKARQLRKDRRTDKQKRRQRLKRVSFRPKEHSPPMEDETSVSTRRLLGVSCVRVCASPSPPNHPPPIHAEVEGGFIETIALAWAVTTYLTSARTPRLNKKLLYGDNLQPAT